MELPSDEVRKDALKDAGRTIADSFPGSRLFMLWLPPTGIEGAGIFFSSLARDDTLELLRDFVKRESQ